MKAALYARVSKPSSGDPEAQKLQDPENQLPDMRRFAAGQGWQVVEYVDEHSAALGRAHKRPQFQQLMDDALHRRFDVVLFWSLDRFTREGAQPTLEILNKLSAYGVKWQSYTEQYLSSLGLWGDAIVAILATIARQETVRQSERVKAGLARRKANGLPIGRQPKVFRRDQARELRATCTCRHAFMSHYVLLHSSGLTRRGPCAQTGCECKMFTPLSWSKIAAKVGASVSTVRRACQEA